MKILIHDAVGYSGYSSEQRTPRVVEIFDGGTLILWPDEGIAPESVSDWLKLKDITIVWAKEQAALEGEQHASKRERSLNMKKIRHRHLAPPVPTNYPASKSTPAKEPLHAYIVTWEGWGSAEDFSVIASEVVEAHSDPAAALMSGLTEGSKFDETEGGSSITEVSKHQQTPVLVYELRLIAKYDRVAPEPVPPPHISWKRRAPLGK